MEAPRGTIKLPGHSGPPIQPGDPNRNPLADYEEAQAGRNEMAMAWIRRAMHAEAFAVALETELQTARAKLEAQT